MSKSVHSFNKNILFLIFLLTTNFWDQITIAQPTPKQPKSIHEADQEDLKVLAHITDLQRIIYAQINVSGSRSRIQELKKLARELEVIAEDYTQLSPGTAFLGPFSSMSLVLKQRELQKRIAQIEKQIFD